MDIGDCEHERPAPALGGEHGDERVGEFLARPDCVETVEGRRLTDEVQIRLHHSADLDVVLAPAEQLGGPADDIHTRAIGTGVTELERIVERRCERPPHIGLAVRNARTEEHGDAMLAASRSDCLLGKPALADATLAIDRNKQRTPFRHGVVDCREEQSTFLVPADERCVAPATVLARPEPCLDSDPGLDRLLAALGLERTVRPVPDRTVAQRLRRLTDKNTPHGCHSLEP